VILAVFSAPGTDKLVDYSSPLQLSLSLYPSLLMSLDRDERTSGLILQLLLPPRRDFITITVHLAKEAFFFLFNFRTSPFLSIITDFAPTPPSLVPVIVCDISPG